MKIKIIQVFLIVFLFSVWSCRSQEKNQPDKMDWWREARFGLFIHWGLYSIPAGEWEGETRYAEWIRDDARIPLEQYNKLMKQFNPQKFNADDWVALAKNAGMKYIVITSKHHDGFCLFNSKETDFDIMSTPFKRDVLKELSEACQKQGITLCFYYSIMDWHHPDYLPRRSWEKNRSSDDANMNRYIGYMKNQLNELLTNYGRIGVLWFDGEWENTWNHELGSDLYHYLRNLNPKLIINNRVDIARQVKTEVENKSFCGDFGTPEQEIPSTGLPETDWESCITMNDHWGFNKNDQNCKSSEDLIRKLIDIASKGGNFLLNVGPTSQGLIPEANIERLKEIGIWMKENGKAIYGTHASPFEQLNWGRCTQKTKDGNTILFFHIFNWPENGKLLLPKLKNEIVRTYALKDKEETRLPVEITNIGTISVDVNRVRRSNFATVIVLEIKGSFVKN